MLTHLFTDPFSTLVTIFAFIIAITIHEYAHAWAATRLGDSLPESEGRLSLNPLAHLDPVGSLSILIAGFGWGKPVRYNPSAFANRSAEVMVALAGPISNLGLALLVNLLSTGLSRISGFEAALQVGGVIVSINVLLAAFNLLPLPPLDGSAIVAYFFPAYRSGRAVMIGSFALIGSIVLFPGLLYTLIHPVIRVFTWLISLGGWLV